MTPDGRFFEPACIQLEMIDAMPKIEGIKPDFDGSLPKNTIPPVKSQNFSRLRIPRFQPRRKHGSSLTSQTSKAEPCLF